MIPTSIKTKTWDAQQLHEKQITHIVKGDSGDSVPAILSEDDIFSQIGKRQPSVSAKRLAEFILIGKDACATEFEIKNWERNETLVALDCIPVEMAMKIIKEYRTNPVVGNRTKILEFFIQQNFRMLFDSVNEY